MKDNIDEKGIFESFAVECYDNIRFRINKISRKRNDSFEI
jgi:hypothetical protein